MYGKDNILRCDKCGLMHEEDKTSKLNCTQCSFGMVVKNEVGEYVCDRCGHVKQFKTLQEPENVIRPVTGCDKCGQSYFLDNHTECPHCLIKDQTKGRCDMKDKDDCMECNKGTMELEDGYFVCDMCGYTAAVIPAMKPETDESVKMTEEPVVCKKCNWSYFDSDFTECPQCHRAKALELGAAEKGVEESEATQLFRCGVCGKDTDNHIVVSGEWFYCCPNCAEGVKNISEKELREKHLSALDTQVGGDHYKHFAIQPTEFITKNNLGFLQGCVVKRICRYKLPGGKGLEDLQKIKHEVDMLIELEGVT